MRRVCDPYKIIFFNIAKIPRNFSSAWNVAYTGYLKSFIFFSQANDNVFQLQKPLLYTETLAEPVKIPQTTRKIILKIGFLFWFVTIFCFVFNVL